MREKLTLRHSNRYFQFISDTIGFHIFEHDTGKKVSKAVIFSKYKDNPYMLDLIIVGRSADYFMRADISKYPAA